jgi:hypothetical protein
MSAINWGISPIDVVPDDVFCWGIGPDEVVPDDVIHVISRKSQLIRDIDGYIASFTELRKRINDLTEEQFAEEFSEYPSIKEPKVKPIKQPKVKPIKEPKVKPIKESTKPKRRRATKAEMRARQEKLVEEFMKEAEKYLA